MKGYLTIMETLFEIYENIFLKLYLFKAEKSCNRNFIFSFFLNNEYCVSIKIKFLFTFTKNLINFSTRMLDICLNNTAHILYH